MSASLVAFVTSFAVVALAEMGDKTQLATVALGARYGTPAVVTAGTTLGMLAADGLAVVTDTTLAAKLSMLRVRQLAAALFFLFGAAAAARALGLV